MFMPQLVCWAQFFIEELLLKYILNFYGGNESQKSFQNQGR